MKISKRYRYLFITVLVMVFCLFGAQYYMESYIDCKTDTDKEYAKDFDHIQTKKYAMRKLQQEINKKSTKGNYRLEGMPMEIHVNTYTDQQFIKKLLDKSKPLFGTHFYQPSTARVFVGEYDIGFAGRGHYYWKGADENSLGFQLNSTDNGEIWDFLNSIPLVTGHSLDLRGVKDISLEVSPYRHFIGAIKPYIVTNDQEINSFEFNEEEQLILKGDTDLYILGEISGEVDSIVIKNADQEVVSQFDTLRSDQFTIVRDLPKGEYTVEVNQTNNSSSEVAYMLNIYQTATPPKLKLPEMLGRTNILKIYNPYEYKIIMMVNGKKHYIHRGSEEWIELVKGDNMLEYYFEYGLYGSLTSESVKHTITVNL